MELVPLGYSTRVLREPKEGLIILHRSLPTKDKGVAISHWSEIYMEITCRALEP